MCDYVQSFFSTLHPGDKPAHQVTAVMPQLTTASRQLVERQAGGFQE
jgi:hypothetical protein